MDTLIDPARPSADVEHPLDERSLDVGELDIVHAAVKSWLDSYGASQFADLPGRMSVRRATLIPILKAQLQTRFETRSLSSQTKPFEAGMVYEKRNFHDHSFPIWSYLVGEGVGNLRAGVVPPSITQKISYSDVMTDCSACRAIGSTRCTRCGGQGRCQCRSCGGDREVKCTSCSGAGEKKCWTCNGHGEKTCYACRSGTLNNGERCRACHGRGFTRCNECRDGFKGCGTCARQGIVRCPTCDATGRERCGGCNGAGKIRCEPCKGSGKFLTSLYLTASQTEKVAEEWTLPPEFDELVPEDVAAWLRRNVGITAARELSTHQFDAVPGELADSPLAETADRLIRESKRDVRCRSEADQVDVSDGPVDRIVQHWYAEHYLPLVKVDYRFEGQDYTLWTVAPGVTLTDHERGYATKGTSVFASEGPVKSYLEGLLAAAESALEQGNLAETARLAHVLLKAVPSFGQASLLKSAAIRTQRSFALLGSLMAVAGASALYLARLQFALPAHVSGGAVAGLVVGALAVAAPFAVSRIVYKTKAIAVFAQCALVGGILLPVVATLMPAAPRTAPALAPVVASVSVAGATGAVESLPPAAGFDCGKSSTVVEKMICADGRLSALDGKLARLYKNVLASAEDPDAMRGEQRAWLQKVRNRCRDLACLKQAYEAQIARFGRVE